MSELQDYIKKLEADVNRLEAEIESLRFDNSEIAVGFVIQLDTLTSERDALRAEVEELGARIEKALEYVDSFETSQLNPARTMLKTILSP